jgi:hypothetical protein
MARNYNPAARQALQAIPHSHRPPVVAWLEESARSADRTACRVRDAANDLEYPARKGTVAYWRSVARACRLLAYRLRTAAQYEPLLEADSDGNKG